MPGAHRHGDSRFCGATTTVIGQDSVFVGDKLWAVVGDPNTHGGGALIAVYGSKDIFIGNKLIIVAIGDIADIDGLLHPTGATDPSGKSNSVEAYIDE